MDKITYTKTCDYCGHTETRLVIFKDWLKIRSSYPIRDKDICPNCIKSKNL